jgi:tetratricopeptide (TPR) repeat protein
LLVAQDTAVLQGALDDGLTATAFVPEDDDYQLLVAVCLIRLQRLDEAVSVLEAVLQRSPRNEKALYQMAFCQRTRGRQKDAIEGLTRIIA